MALQINGTTVVNNSRQLQNIASLDSTSAATIGAAAGGEAYMHPVHAPNASGNGNQNTVYTAGSNGATFITSLYSNSNSANASYSSTTWHHTEGFYRSNSSQAFEGWSIASLPSGATANVRGSWKAWDN